MHVYVITESNNHPEGGWTSVHSIYMYESDADAFMVDKPTDYTKYLMTYSKRKHEVIDETAG